MSTAPTLIDKLKALTPTQFENVVYDLVTSAGLRNPVWRTPGADGGRDIEGMMVTTDFSGFHAMTKWHIECKRYTNAVDWPTVYGKIAYADSHRADYLLMVTTASLSPVCKSEIATWNSDRRRPAVRYWDGTDIEQMLIQHPRVLVKHGLTPDTRLLPASFLSLAQQTSKVVRTAYGVAATFGQVNSALDAASALAELLSVRIRDAESGRSIVKSSFAPAEDSFSWLTLTGESAELVGFDRHGLRAVLALLRHITESNVLSGSLAFGSLRVTQLTDRLTNTMMPFLAEVAAWGELEIRLDGQDVIVARRL